MARFFADFAVTSVSNPALILSLLSDILRSRAVRTIGKVLEPNLPGIFELVFRNKYCIPDRLLDGPQIYCAQEDLSIARVRIRGPYPSDEMVVTWELRTLSLLGMWRGKVELDGDTPSVAELSEFHQQLIHEDEVTLLSRPYRSWFTKSHTFETRLVREIVDEAAAAAKVDCTALVVAVGGAHVILRDLLQ